MNPPTLWIVLIIDRAECGLPLRVLGTDDAPMDELRHAYRFRSEGEAAHWARHLKYRGPEWSRGKLLAVVPVGSGTMPALDAIRTFVPERVGCL